MRSLLGFLVFTAVLVTLGLTLLVPPIVGPLVVARVREASPFGDQPLDITADVNAIGLIRGFVGEIHVSGKGLARDAVGIGQLDITVHDVAIGDHSFSSVVGRLDAVTVPLPDEVTMLSIERIDVSGPSTALVATAHLSRDEALAFLRWSFADAGITVDELDLIPGGISFVIFDQRVEVPVGPQDGALVIADLLGTGPMELLTPQTPDPWRITGVTVSPGGMDIIASVDTAGLLAGR
jgi:hypothetical protein